MMIRVGGYQIHLTNEDTFSVKSIYFDIPENAEKLRIAWNYSPKGRNDIEACEKIAEPILKGYIPDDVERKVLFDFHVGKVTGLKNQLGFTLLSQEGFHGDANARKKVVEISDTSATPGFLPKVPHGPCTILVNVFCVYTEFCDVSFEIEYE